MLLERIVLSALTLAFAAAPVVHAAQIQLLNVSYDATRELYREYDKAFATEWKAKTGDDVVTRQSHSGSGKQARTVIDGIPADVVTLALAPDIDAIAQRGLIEKNWQQRLAHHSSPYTSTIVFLVRKGNPKGIRGWGDLVRPDIQVITPNPKTSGGARWNFLAAWGYALRLPGGTTESARKFVGQIYGRVPVLDSGARGSTTTFAERSIGDVLLTWENEAFLAIKELGADKVEIVVPSTSILAEPPVALVDKNIDRHGTRKVAQAYLDYLYSDVGQDIAGRNYYRPTSEKAARKYAAQFPKINLFTVEDVAGSWGQAQNEFFGDGGIFDQIYMPRNQ